MEKDDALLLFTLAYALDWLVGDPEWAPHPVRWMGRLIQVGEGFLRRLIRTPRAEFVGGLLLSLSVVGVFGVEKWRLLGWLGGSTRWSGIGMNDTSTSASSRRDWTTRLTSSRPDLPLRRLYWPRGRSVWIGVAPGARCGGTARSTKARTPDVPKPRWRARSACNSAERIITMASRITAIVWAT